MGSTSITLQKKNACIAENLHMVMDVFRLLPESIFMAAAAANANIAEK